MLKTLVDQAKRICEPWFLDAELQHLEVVLQSNGYSAVEVRRAAQQRRSSGSVSQEFVSSAVLPCI